MCSSTRRSSAWPFVPWLEDSEAAQLMGVNFSFIVLLTFALGSGVAAFAGLDERHLLQRNQLQHGRASWSHRLQCGSHRRSAAISYGAIIGGFVFAFLQTIGAVALPFSSAYKDVFAFAVVIVLMAIRPTGFLAERSSQRV